MKEYIYDKRRLRLIQENIVFLETEAIVNAANKSLILGGGVAGAIRQHGGPSIQKECNETGPIEVGEAVITKAGNLKAKYVIHAAGPVYGEGDEDEKLRSATLSSLQIACQKNIKSIAFPAISTGIFHFPVQRCSEIMLKTALEFLRTRDLPEEIVFCLYDLQTYNIFEKTLKKLTEE